MARTPTIQRSYRFRADLLERFEARVPRSQRTATVAAVLEEWLNLQEAWEPRPEPPSAHVEPAKFARVVNPAGAGTLVRIADADLEAWGPGALVGVIGPEARPIEGLRVRERDGDLLTVDRAVCGGEAALLSPGAELCVVGYVEDEASPAADDLSPVGAAAGRSGADLTSDRAADGSEAGGGESESHRAAPPVSPGPGADKGGSVSAGTDAPSSATAPDGERAVSAAAVPDGQARARVAPAPSETSDFAGDGLDPVDLAVELAGKTGDPAAVWRARIREDRVTVAGRPFKSGIIDRGLLEHVELDGARVYGE